MIAKSVINFTLAVWVEKSCFSYTSSVIRKGKPEYTFTTKN